MNSNQERAYEFKQEAAEDEANRQHDIDHSDDPAYYWDDCSICAERVTAEIADGLRCQHGILKSEPCVYCPKDERDIDQMIENDIDFAKESAHQFQTES